MYNKAETESDVQVSLVCQRVQTRAGPARVWVALDVGVVLIVEALDVQLNLRAARNDALNDVGKGQIHDDGSQIAINTETRESFSPQGSRTSNK